MKKFGLFVLIILSLFITQKSFAQDSNAGFIPSNIWYSNDNPAVGEKIQIYTVIFNPDKRELSGTVSFFDKTTFLGKKNFILPSKGVKDIFIDWIVTEGDHNIFGKIENAKFLNTNGKYEEVYLSVDETEKSSLIIKTKTIEATEGDENETPTDSSSIEKLVSENTPVFVKNIVNTTIDAVEGFRTDTGNDLQKREEELKTELDQASINTLNAFVTNVDEVESDENAEDFTKTIETKDTIFVKPFKYIKLFFLMVMTGILQNKAIFYLSILLLIFIVFRLIMR